VSYQHGLCGDGQVAQDRAGYHEFAVSGKHFFSPFAYHADQPDRSIDIVSRRTYQPSLDQV
jgi:hypothetical protein